MLELKEPEFDFRNVREMVTPSLLTAIDLVPSDYWELSPRELEKLTRKQAFNSTDRALRVSFWDEYTRASSKGTSMRVVTIIQGICSSTYFSGTFLKDPARVAFMLTPPVEFDRMKKVLSSQAMETIEEILNTPHIEGDKVNAKVMEAKLKAAALAIQLDQGAIVQRIENKNLNMNASIQVEDRRAPESIEEIDRRLAELEQGSTIVVQPPREAHVEILPGEIIEVRSEVQEV